MQDPSTTSGHLMRLYNTPVKIAAMLILYITSLTVHHSVGEANRCRDQPTLGDDAIDSKWRAQDDDPFTLDSQEDQDEAWAAYRHESLPLCSLPYKMQLSRPTHERYAGANAQDEHEVHSVWYKENPGCDNLPPRTRRSDTAAHTELPHAATHTGCVPRRMSRSGVHIQRLVSTAMAGAGYMIFCFNSAGVGAGVALSFYAVLRGRHARDLGI